MVGADTEVSQEKTPSSRKREADNGPHNSRTKSPKSGRDNTAGTSSCMTDADEGDRDMLEGDEEDLWEDEEAIESEGGNSSAEGDDGGAIMEDEACEETSSVKAVFRPGVDELKDGEELTFNQELYRVFHRGAVEWPCLSFDFISDNLGVHRTKTPFTVYVAAGTQAAGSGENGNGLCVMKWSELHRTMYDDREDIEEDEEDDDELEDTDDDARLDMRFIPHSGGAITAVRTCPQVRRLVSTWGETGVINVWDIDQQLSSLDDPSSVICDAKPSPLFTFNGHKGEGFALKFNPVLTGEMISGGSSKDGALYHWKRSEAGQWEVSQLAPPSNTAIEGVDWKRLGDGSGYVFSTGSSDSAVRIYDTRVNKPCVMTLSGVHEGDINTVCWNPIRDFLLLSGGDDKSAVVWDTRKGGGSDDTRNRVSALLKFHHDAVSSVDWHPSDEATFLSSSYDDTIAIWDLSVEPDEDEVTNTTNVENVEDFPDQLLFHHLGQHHIAEAKWHPQIPSLIVSTAEDGFNVFQPSNLVVS